MRIVVNLPYSLMFFFYLSPLIPIALLFLRCTVGAVFLVHGPPKMKMSEQMSGGLGMSAQRVWILGLVETMAGLSVLFGLLTQLGALTIAVVMAGALHYKINKWRMPFTAMDKTGWEFDLVLLASALLLIATGAGPISLDWIVFGR